MGDAVVLGFLKKTLLATVAAVALVSGSALESAIAQQCSNAGGNGCGLGSGFAVGIGDIGINGQAAGGSTPGTPSAVAVGNGSIAGSGFTSGFIGTSSGDVAVGDHASATANLGTALGAGASATGANSVALGANSADGGQSNVVSVGGVGSERRVINVAPGTNGTDAVNLNQLNAVDARIAGITPGLSSVSTDGTLTGNGTAASPLGVAPSVLNSITAAQNTATAAQGAAARAQSTANGAQTTATAAQAAAATAQNTANAAQGTASTALGLAQNSVQYDNAAHNSVSLNPGDAAAGLHNVGPGAVTASSTDAINGSQLFGVTTSVNSLGTSTAANLGGGATYNPAAGSVSAPSYTIGGSSYNNVGAAFAAINSTGVKYFHSNSSLADSTATGTDSTAIGPQAAASGASSIAIGNAASATATNGVALGAGAKATNPNDVAMGAGSVTAAPHVGAYTINGGAIAAASASSVVSVGSAGAERQIQNVAAGVVSASSTDAINGSQLYAVGSALNTLGTSTAANLGGGASYNPTAGTVSAPSYQIGSTTYNNVGSALAAINSTGVKYFHTNSSLADATATGTDSTAIGPQAAASGASSIALGNGANAAATNGVALGSGAKATNPNDVALGAGAIAAAPNVGAYTVNGGTIAAASPRSVVSVGTAGAERQIQNVAAGVVSTSSTDAVNGSQLYAVGSALNNLGTSTAANLGGGATYNPSTGTISAPSYQIANTNYNNVGAALSGLNSEINGPTPTVVRYDVNSAGQPQNSVTLTGASNGQPVAIHNVAPGVNGTDAVTLNQLNGQIGGLSTSVNNRFAGDEARISKANRTARAAGAAGMATANLRYDDQPYAGSVAAALGGWKGSTAIAAGVGYNWNTVRIQASGTFVSNTGDVGWGAGASWRFW
ncbi:Head domain of trimeric autotransporter adhesin [Rhizobiales bacterium GAS191]|nr:Head domain of trimeric autotransporter adhesin [Rhizobiales bacterium GAS191]